VARPKTKDERLFSAAVVRYSFTTRGEEQKAAFDFVYQGVLRDLGLSDDDVLRYLGEHEEEVKTALGRK
jgi:hypothetical protein